MKILLLSILLFSSVEKISIEDFKFKKPSQTQFKLPLWFKIPEKPSDKPYRYYKFPIYREPPIYPGYFDPTHNNPVR